MEECFQVLDEILVLNLERYMPERLPLRDFVYVDGSMESKAESESGPSVGRGTLSLLLDVPVRLAEKPKMKKKKDETTRWPATMFSTEDTRHDTFPDTSERWLESMSGISTQSSATGLISSKGLAYVDDLADERVENQKPSSTLVDDLGEWSLLEEGTTQWLVPISDIKVMPDVSASSKSMELPPIDVNTRKTVESLSDSQWDVLGAEQMPNPGSDKNMIVNVPEQVHAKETKEGSVVSSKLSSMLADESLRTSQPVDVTAVPDFEKKIPSIFPEPWAIFTYSSSLDVDGNCCSSMHQGNLDHSEILISDVNQSSLKSILDCQLDKTFLYFSSSGEEMFVDPFQEVKGDSSGFQGRMDVMGIYPGGVLNPQVTADLLGTCTGGITSPKVRVAALDTCTGGMSSPQAEPETLGACTRGITNPEGPMDASTRDFTQVDEGGTTGTHAGGISSPKITGGLCSTFEEKAKVIAMTMMGKVFYREKEKTGSAVLPLLLASLQDLLCDNLKLNSGIIEIEAAKWVYKYMSDNNKKIALHPPHVRAVPSIWRRKYPDQVYPSSLDMDVIASVTGLQKKQVVTLFENDRKREARKDPDSAQKLKRHFSAEINNKLGAYQSENPDNRRRDPDSRKRLMRETGLDQRQLADWFNNHKRSRNHSRKKHRVDETL